MEDYQERIRRVRKRLQDIRALHGAVSKFVDDKSASQAIVLVLISNLERAVNCLRAEVLDYFEALPETVGPRPQED